MTRIRDRVTALRRLVPGRFLLERQEHWRGPQAPIVSHEVPAHLEDAFRAAGYESRFFFPHRYHCLPKCGPDGARLARAMCGVRRVGQLWQIVVHATGPAVESLPRELFLDPDITWHGQQ